MLSASIAQPLLGCYHTYVIRLLSLLTLAGLLGAEDHWVSVRSGPFQIFSNTGDKSAREQLQHLEQFRQGLGVVLGKQDLHLLWPLRIVISKNEKYIVPPGLPLARDAYFGLPAHDLTSRDLKTLARLLIAQNTQRLPAEIENGIVDLFSTVEITGARITLGAALPPAQRTRDWARMHLLVTDPAYSGRARVMISNLEQGSELNTAYKNAFERTGAQIEKQVDDYLAAGTFGTENISGSAINSTRDFHVQTVDSYQACWHWPTRCRRPVYPRQAAHTKLRSAQSLISIWRNERPTSIARPFWLLRPPVWIRAGQSVRRPLLRNGSASARYATCGRDRFNGLVGRRYVRPVYP